MRENPIRVARDNANLSQVEVATYSGISPQAVLRAEQGLMSSPPGTLIELLSVSRQDYLDWVSEKRDANFKALRLGRYHGDTKLLPNGEGYTLASPSVSAFAKAIVVQISMVQKYVSEQRGTVIPEILLEWGVKSVQIN